MNRFCISVDISTLFMLFDDSMFQGLNSLKLDWGEKKYFFESKYGAQLDVLKSEVESEIENLLSIVSIERQDVNLELPGFKRTLTEVHFKGQSITVDFRTETGFKLSGYVGLFNLAVSASRLGGVLYVFNRTLAENKMIPSLIQILREKNGITQYDIEHLNEDLSSQWRIGIEHAEDNGLIYFDKGLGKYYLTSRGYAYW